MVPAVAVGDALNLAGEAWKHGPESQGPGEVGAPVEALCIPICAGFVDTEIQVTNVVSTFAHKEIVTAKDASHWGEEDAPAGENSDENSGLCDVLPGANGDGDDGDDVGAAPDIDIFGHQGRHVHACRDAVEDDAKGKLGAGETHAGEEGAGAGASGERIRLDGEEEFKRVPVHFTVDLSGSGGDEEAAESGNTDG